MSASDEFGTVAPEPKRCNGNTTATRPFTWYLDIYDVVRSNQLMTPVWYGPFVVFTESIGLPECVAKNQSGNGATDTGTDVHIAVDTTTDFFWVTHVKGAPCSGQGCPKKQTRTSEVAVDYGWLNCPSNPPPPGCVEGQPCPSVITPWSPPPGGTGVDAAWVPGIASAHLTPVAGQCPIPNLAPPCQRTVVYWYATYADPNPNSNRLAAVYMSFEENYGLFSLPQQISAPSSGQVVPWNNDAATYWDFQHLGVNSQRASFMAVWNDRREPNPADAKFWSDLLE